MRYNLINIISSIKVTNKKKIFLEPKNPSFNILIDYLNNTVDDESYLEEMALFKKLENYIELRTYNERWDFF